MKSKFTKILGVVVTIAVLAGMLVASVPASGHSIFKAQWWSESEPNSATSYKNLIVNGLAIMDVAANGDIVYVACNNAGGGQTLYKSTDGGATFESLENSTLFPATYTVIKKVAIAKEDANVVAFITNNGTADQVYYTTTGGALWTSLGAPATGAVLNDIDVYGGSTVYVAAAGNIGGVAELYTYRVAILQNWTARYSAAGGAAAGQTDIKAVLISPGFGTEKAILSVSTNGSNQGILQVFRYETGNTKWNGQVTYLDATDWGTGIVLTPNTAVVGGLATADIAVPSDYLANDDDQRVAYVSTSGVTSGGGVTRIIDVVQSDFLTWSGGLPGPIYSIAYSEGKLVAGDANEAQVYQYLSPTAPLVKATKVNALKQPGGSTTTTVVYAGDSVVATTGGDEGGLALSTDDGYSFNDVALINTTIAAIPDFDVAADGSKIYLVTYDSDNDTSVWMKSGFARYKRVFGLQDDQTNRNLLVRMAPEDSSAVYLAQLGTQNMWVSKNSGTELWKAVSAYKLTGGTILDFAVESADVVYAVDNDSCSKSVDSGTSWGTAKAPAEGMSPYMITVASNGDVIIGGTTTYYYYSKDGGATFSRSGTLVFGSNTIVVPDDGYADNGIVYVGTTFAGSGSVKRGSLSGIPASTRGATTGYAITGMGQSGGVLYVIGCNGTDSVLYQSLSIETAADTTTADWSNDTAVTADYNAGRNGLKISSSGGMPTLWCIDTSTTDDLDSFTDPVSLSAPTVTGPDDEAAISVNPKSGAAYDVTFRFNKYNDTDIDAARLQVATDPDFNALVADVTNAAALTTVAQAWLIGPNGANAASTVNYLPGETYYWRLRTTSPVNSPWTATRSFTIAGLEEPFAVSGPEVGAGDVSTLPILTWAEYEGAIKYQVEICELPDFAILEVSANTENPFYAVGADDELDYSTTYYWRVRGLLTEPEIVGRGYVYDAGPWITGVFTTMAEPVTVEDQEPTVIVEHEPAPPPEVVTIETETPVIPTYLLWVIVGVGAVLIIALIVLIVRTRRVA